MAPCCHERRHTLTNRAYAVVTQWSGKRPNIASLRPQGNRGGEACGRDVICRQGSGSCGEVRCLCFDAKEHSEWSLALQADVRMLTASGQLDYSLIAFNRA